MEKHFAVTRAEYDSKFTEYATGIVFCFGRWYKYKSRIIKLFGQLVLKKYI